MTRRAVPSAIVTRAGKDDRWCGSLWGVLAKPVPATRNTAPIAAARDTADSVRFFMRQV
jgi:hypothetical protein